MMRLKYFFSAVLICLAFSSNAQNSAFKSLNGSDRDVFSKNLYSASEKISTLQCNFQQKQHLSLLSEDVSSKGTMTFKKPDKLLWIYSSPYNSVFLMNGGKITTKNEGKTVTIDSGSSPLMKELCKIMIAGLRGDTKNLETSFTTSYFTNGTQIKVSMKPKNKSLASIFKKIDLIFDAKTYLVSSIDMSEPSGDNTIILISNINVNQTVNEAVFNIY